jgi:NAD(P)-dependent dehydrogenase (short-subunit alcohol dehydrogenase family)
MKIRNSVAFVTGANRGIGLAFAQKLLARGGRERSTLQRASLSASPSLALSAFVGT